MSPRNASALSLVEALIALVVLFVALFVIAPLFLMPISGSDSPDGRMIQTLSNMKQLHLATHQMELDRASSGNTNIGWPGDIGGTFSNWATQLVGERYLSPSDLCKLLSAPGVAVPLGTIPMTNNTAVLVYAVSTNSPDETIFLTTANFTNTPSGGVLNLKAKPYGGKGFLVFNKGGGGDILFERNRRGYNDPPEITVFQSYADEGHRLSKGLTDIPPKPYQDKGPTVFRVEGNGDTLLGDSTNRLGSFVPLCR